MEKQAIDMFDVELICAVIQYFSSKSNFEIENIAYFLVAFFFCPSSY